MIYTRFTSNGSVYTDPREIIVNRSMTRYGEVSNFQADFDNQNGIHKNDFTINDNIQINAGRGDLNGITHQWRLDEGSGTILFNDINNEFKGDNRGGVYTTGKIGNRCLDFAGGSDYPYAFLGGGSILFPSGQNWTMSMWVSPGSIQIADIAQVSNNTGLVNEFGLNQSGNSLRFNYRKADGTIEVGNELINNFTVGSWYLATISYNGTQFKGFVGSVHYVNVIDTFRNAQPSSSFFLTTNADNEVNSNHFVGKIDDVRIYRKDWSLAEQKALFNNGSGNDDRRIFVGTIEDIQRQGEPSREYLTLIGRDYSSRLLDNSIPPVVYTNTEAGEIIKNLITSNEIKDITTNNVINTGVIVPRIAFNHTSIWDGIKQLADLAGCIVYIDEFKDMHLEVLKSKSSNFNIEQNVNLTDIRFDTSRKDMANKIWVYGDKYLTGFKQQFEMTGGSVINLFYSPHNPDVSYLGSSLIGAINGITASPTSGTDYSVDFYGKQIIFASGTSLGYSSIPINGGSVIVNYDRELIIAKYGQNDLSIELNGPKDLVINDTSIKDPQTALDLVKEKIAESDPLTAVDCKINGFPHLNPGETVGFTYDTYDIDEDGISLLDVGYEFTKENNLSENVLNLRLSNKISDITDSIKDLSQRLSDLESQNLQDQGVLTRLVYSSDNLDIVGSRWNVYSRTINDSFILGHPINGKLGSQTFQPLLGDHRSGLVLLYSGGNNYSVTGSYNPEAGIGDMRLIIFA